MAELREALVALLTAGGGLAAAVFGVIAPAVPLLAWAAFSYFAVDWYRLRSLLARGGVLPVLLLSAAAVAVGVAVDPVSVRSVGPVPVSSVVHKTAWATALLAVAALAGAARLSRTRRLKVRSGE